LRTKLPADDVLDPWIEEMRTWSRPPLQATTAGNPATASGSAAATGRAIASVMSSGAARLGAAVSAVALSAVPLLPAVFPGGESPPLSEETTPVVDVREAEATTSHQLLGGPSPQADEAPLETADTDTAIREGPKGVEEPPPVGPILDEASRRAGPVAARLEVGIPDAVTSVVEDLVEPLVAETVESLSDDVVEPLVEVVEGTVEVATDATQPLVDEAVPALEAVPRLPDGLTQPVDDVVSGLGGLVVGG
ncbi:MAG TPA: hypothetical protein VF083_04920, partial [Acidimicrobiia bacterium]